MIGDAWPGGKDVVKLGVEARSSGSGAQGRGQSPLDPLPSVAQPGYPSGEPGHTAADPHIEADEEVRLAVVLYGGSSLCIYMNGVAQELLRLVRATAGDSFGPEAAVALPTKGLDGTERVYRRLAQLAPDDPGTHWSASDPLHRRFVIDILTGSSAGGINGIFLAKALANNQNLDELKKLWIEKGDIAQLYNDGKHSKDVNLKPERPPTSLLDGRWMYANLMAALDGMGSDRQSPTPLVRELDLFVTATDLYGLPVSVRLANGAAVERKHRQIFHFKYEAQQTGHQQNDFLANNNPFLAFAARCTSSLPFVFQPMTLATIDDVLPHVPTHSSDTDRSRNQEWTKFYWDYSAEPSRGQPSDDPKQMAVENFRSRPFGDGGSLDNSPFTFATDMLAHRHGELPVSRKLLYLEPDPVTEESWALPSGLPNAGQNFLMQFVMLPRSQTVSEDLRALKARNRVIRRVQEVLAAADPVLAVPDSVNAGPNALPAAADLEEPKGQAYNAYRRLKAAAVVDDLATLAVRLGGLEEDSDEWGAVRALVQAWRLSVYEDKGDPADVSSSGKSESPGRSENKPLDQFLIDFDLGFRLRKVNFVERVASELDRAVAWRMLNSGSGEPVQPTAQTSRGIARLQRCDVTDDELKPFQAEVRKVREALMSMGNALWRARNDVADTDNAMRRAFGAAGLSRTVVQCDLLDKSRTADELARNAETFVTGHMEGFAAIAQLLRARLAEAFTVGKEGSSAGWLDVLDKRDTTAPSAGAQKARACLRYYFEHYEPYDVLILPIVYGTDAGESALVEIFRISPVDAPTLGDWDLSPKSHVAGNRYGHFGAFLEKVWRQNDVMWGRMDAAGCIIDALMPDYKKPEDRDKVRDVLIREAHQRIVREELGETGRQTLTNMVLNELARVPPSPPHPIPMNETAVQKAHRLEVQKAVAQVVEQVGAAQSGSRLQQLLIASVGEADLLDYVTRTQQTEWKLPPADELLIATRGTHVFGEVLKGMSGGKGALARPGAWMSMVGRMGSGVAEVALTRSMGHLLRWHWLSLIIAFAGLTIVGGLVTSTPAVTQFGLMAFLLTLLVAGAVWSMSQYFRSRQWWKTFPLVVLVLALGGLMALGVVELAHLGKQHSWIPVFGQTTPARSSSPSP
jgi:patatin-related protein